MHATLSIGYLMELPWPCLERTMMEGICHLSHKGAGGRVIGSQSKVFWVGHDENFIPKKSYSMMMIWWDKPPVVQNIHKPTQAVINNSQLWMFEKSVCVVFQANRQNLLKHLPLKTMYKYVPVLLQWDTCLDRRQYGQDICWLRYGLEWEHSPPAK